LISLLILEYFVDYGHKISYNKLAQKTFVICEYRLKGIKEDISLLCESLVEIRGSLRCNIN